MNGVSVETIVQRWPRLYHMAAAGSWPSIKQHGLLSTAALVRLFAVAPAERERLLGHHRPDNVIIEHPEHGRAIIRDQKPMDDKGLRRCLQDGLSPREWYLTLNDKVFFWLNKERLAKMLNARAYRDMAHTVLEVDTGGLLARHASEVVLSPMNSGCTKPFPHPRGRQLFRPLSEYPWGRRAQVNRREPAVELAVPGGVPDIASLVVLVREVAPRDAMMERSSTVVWEP